MQAADGIIGAEASIVSGRILTILSLRSTLRLITVLSLLLLLALAALTSAPAAAAPPVTEGWLDDLAAARSRAESEGKPILVDLWADWCTWCKRLEKEVFSTPEFAEYAKGFVLLRVDTEDGADGTRLMEDFEVESLPTTLVLSHDLIKLGGLQGFLPAPQYLLSLELETSMYAGLVRTYEDHRTARAAGAVATKPPEGVADTLQTLADELHSRRDGARAAELYRELIARGAENAEEQAWNHFYYADSLRLGHAFEKSREAVVKARAAAAGIDNDELNERIDLLPFYLARDVAACAEARQAIDRFVNEHPDGVFLELAREEQRRLKGAEGCA